MPFKSKAQRRWMYANEPEMAKKWSEHTAKGAKLPERVKSANNNNKHMIAQQEAYINGFVKRASQYGLAESQIEHLLKQSGIKDVLFKTMGRTGGTLGGAGGSVLGAGLGGIGGGALGAGIGAFEGIVDPGEEKDPESGEMIEKSIPKAMLAKALRRAQTGALIGGTVGGIGGGAGGAYFGRKGGKALGNIVDNKVPVIMEKIKEHTGDVDPEVFFNILKGAM